MKSWQDTDYRGLRSHLELNQTPGEDHHRAISAVLKLQSNSIQTAIKLAMAAVSVRTLLHYIYRTFILMQSPTSCQPSCQPSGCEYQASVTFISAHFHSLTNTCSTITRHGKPVRFYWNFQTGGARSLKMNGYAMNGEHCEPPPLLKPK